MTNTRIGGCFLLLFFFFDSRYCSKRIAFVAFSASSAHVLHDWRMILPVWIGKGSTRLYWLDLCASYSPPSNESIVHPRHPSDILSKKERGIESIPSRCSGRIKSQSSTQRHETRRLLSQKSVQWVSLSDQCLLFCHNNNLSSAYTSVANNVGDGSCCDAAVVVVVVVVVKPPSPSSSPSPSPTPLSSTTTPKIRVVVIPGVVAGKVTVEGVAAEEKAANGEDECTYCCDSSY